MKMQLSLATLKDFDNGKARVAYENCLAQVVRDCLDRPGDGRLVDAEGKLKLPVYNGRP